MTVLTKLAYRNFEIVNLNFIKKRLNLTLCPMGKCKLPKSRKWPAVDQSRVKFGHLPSFMAKYGNFENWPVSWKPLPVERK